MYARLQILLENRVSNDYLLYTPAWKLVVKSSVVPQRPSRLRDRRRRRWRWRYTPARVDVFSSPPPFCVCVCVQHSEEKRKKEVFYRLLVKWLDTMYLDQNTVVYDFCLLVNDFVNVAFLTVSRPSSRLRLFHHKLTDFSSDNKRAAWLNREWTSVWHSTIHTVTACYSSNSFFTFLLFTTVLSQ